MDYSALLTDGDAMAGPLLQRLVGPSKADWQVEHCTVTQTRRRISRRTREEGAPWLGVCYRVGLRDVRSERRQELWLYAKAYSQGRSEAAYRGALPTACVIPPLGEPVMHMPELDLVLWPLPNDPTMEQLPALLDPAALQPHLARSSPPAGRAEVGEVSVVRYEPEEHCLARIETHERDHDGAIFGKSYAGEQWRDARDCLHSLWCRGCIDPKAFVVGRPLGSCAALRAVWQEEVRGEPLVERLAGPVADATLDVLAAALVALHSGPRLARQARPVGETVELARKWCKKLHLADARFANDLDAVLFHLERRAAPRHRLVTVHGDFHVDQMQWWNGRIALFDYDNFTIDAPARDIADFASQLLCRDDRQADWPALAARFVERYRAHSDGGLHQGELDWYLQLMLLRKAYSFFVRNRAGWHEKTLRALAAARAGIAALPRTKPEPFR